MSARHYHGVLVSEVTYVTQSLTVELVLLRSGLSINLSADSPSLGFFVHGQSARPRMLPDLIRLAKHLDFLQHHGEPVEDFSLPRCLGRQVSPHHLSQLLKQHRVKRIRLRKYIRQIVILGGVL